MLNRISKTVGNRKLRARRSLHVERLESRVVLSANFVSSAPFQATISDFDFFLQQLNTSIANPQTTGPQTIDIGANGSLPFNGNSRTGTINTGATPTASPGGFDPFEDSFGYDSSSVHGFSAPADDVFDSPAFVFGRDFESLSVGDPANFVDAWTAIDFSRPITVDSLNLESLESYSFSSFDATGGVSLSTSLTSVKGESFSGFDLQLIDASDALVPQNNLELGIGSLDSLANVNQGSIVSRSISDSVGPESVLVSVNASLSSVAESTSIESGSSDGGEGSGSSDGSGESDQLASDESGTGNVGQESESASREVTTIDVAVNHMQLKSTADLLAAATVSDAASTQSHVADSGSGDDWQPEMASARHQTFSLAFDRGAGRGEFSADNSESPSLDASSLDRFKTSSRKIGRQQSSRLGGNIENVMLAMGPTVDSIRTLNASAAAGESYSFFQGSTFQSLSNVFPKGMSNGCNLEVVIVATFVGGLVVRQFPGRKDEDQ